MHMKRLEAAGVNIDTLTKLDLLLRTNHIKTFLMASDYHDEKVFETTQELAALMQSFYQRKCALLDLGKYESRKLNHFVDYYNASDLGLDASKELSYSRGLSKTMSTLGIENELIFVIQDVKRNPQATILPETEFDGCLLVRSERSSGVKKSRYVTNLLKDANLPIFGVIYNKVSYE